MKKLLDINGDGVVDSKDAKAAAIIAGTAVASAAGAVGASAAAGATAVAIASNAIATTAVATVGATGGAIIGAFMGTQTIGAAVMYKVGGLLVIETATATTVSGVATAIGASVGSSVAVVSEAATGFIAGMPIVKSLAIASLEKAGEIVVIGGVAYSIPTAIAAGLVALVIVAGVAYLVLKG